MKVMKGKTKNKILKVTMSIVLIVWALLMFTYDSWTSVQMCLYIILSLLLGTFIHVNKEILSRV